MKYVFVIFSLLVFTSFQQQKTDSLILLLKNTQSDTSLVNMYNKISVQFINTGSFVQAKKYVDSAFNIATLAQPSPAIKKGKASAYNIMGIIDYNQGNYPQALNNYYAALKIREEIGDKKGIGASYSNIGNIYDDQGKYDDALRIYLSSMKIRQEINDREGIAIAHNNLGLIYLKLRNYSEALKNHVAALKIRNEIGDKKGIATSYNNIGFVYEEQGNYPNALENYYAAIKIKQEIGDKEGMAITYNNIGDIYLKQNHAAEAKKMQLLSLKFIQEINAKAELMYAYASLALCDSSLGNFKSAYEYYKLYSSSKDSVINEKSIRQIQEMQTKYETEKKEIEIKSQALKILEQKQKLYLNNIALIALVAGIILLLIIIFLIISRNRIRKKEIIQTELLNQQAARTKIIIDTQEKERKRIAQDLHDGIGQTLAAIKMNISSKSNFIDEKDKKIFEHTMTAIDNAYHEVRMLSHSVMPKALKASGLAGAINDLLQQTLLNSRIKYIFEKNIPHRFKEETEVSLYRIFQELFNNILKHANATEISIHLHTANEQIILMVEDNGVGILNSQAQRKDVKGIGLSNIETRVQALHGTFSINTVAGKGTIAIIRIPTSENV